ncbi:MAG: hypothetical protein IJ399_00290 [Bacilli bacterium]|nr:hypothetical protein [Bacilli bacterium]
MENKWRKIDNTAKLFSLDDINNTSIFRFSALLKEEIEPLILKKAVNKSLEDYPSFKVKCCSGLFWNYLDYNKKRPIIKEETEIPCTHINFRKNNDYLFKVTYYKNKINLDLYHVLTDGAGGIIFLKSIIYHYLSIKYNIKYKKTKYMDIGYEDCTLKHYDMSYSEKKDKKPTYKIKGMPRNINNTYHYILDTKEVREISKKNKVSVTTYLVSLYMYALYKSLYDKTSNKELNIIVPINLRPHFQEETMANFFTYMNIYSNFSGKENVTFEEILKHVKKEYKEKYTPDKIKSYLASDVSVGVNIGLRVVPLFVKKFFIRFFGFLRASTTIVSNVGLIELDDKFKNYVDNILMLVMPNNIQKIKCSICSYGNKLNVTMNSIINDLHFEKTFYNILREKFDTIELIGNNDKRSKYVSDKNK